MISKELFIDIMNIELKYSGEHLKYGVIDDFEIVDDEIRCLVFHESKKHKGTGLWSPTNVNIYEFSHKCKVYADRNHYILLTHAMKSELIEKLGSGDTVDTCYNTNFDNATPYDPMMDIEVCQYIVDKKAKS